MASRRESHPSPGNLEIQALRKHNATARLGWVCLKTLCGGPWYSTQEIARFLGLHPSRVQQLEVSGCRKIGVMLEGMRREWEEA